MEVRVKGNCITEIARSEHRFHITISDSCPSMRYDILGHDET
jgi:hypothetical protein